MTPPGRLAMRGIWKSFGGVPVLRDVALDLEAGEVLALLGANGAGKSTLVKILSGVYARDAGEVRIDGLPALFASPMEAAARGVRLLPQEVAVFPDLTVAENIVMADLPARGRGALAAIDRPAMRRAAAGLLDQLGLDIAPDTPMRRLGASEQRIVEIARALAGRARILIMDEPTAALTDQEADRLFAIIGRLKAQGVGIIYISHYLDEVFEVADRIAVLRDGRNAGQFPAVAQSHDDVLEAMLGAGMTDLFPPVAGAPGDLRLQVDTLSVPGALDGIGFAVRSGEILGAFGLIGSGVEVLGRALYGALGPLPRSRQRIDGRDYRIADPRAAMAAGLGFVAAERKREGIIAPLTLRENMTMPFLDRFGSAFAVSVPAETRHVRGWIDRLGIRTRGPEQAIGTLSGGNQQKACIARWLVEGMKVLVLEEPTRGVDIGARREIYAKLRDLTRQGLAVLVTSTDVEEVAGLCDRTIVLARGRVAATFEHGASAAAILASAAGTAQRERAG